MRNRRRGRRFASALALSVLVAVTLAPTSSAATETVVLTAPTGSAPQGVPFRFRALVRNLRPSAARVEITFKIGRVAGGPLIPFRRTLLFVAGSRARAVSASVVTGQWFRQRGRFKIIATIRGRRAGSPLVFRVTASPVPVPIFRDITAAAGVSTTQPDTSCTAPTAGAAWADVESDGDLDLYVPRRAGASHLWINNGSGHFSDEAAERGVENGVVGAGAVFADYDNDGDQDLYVANWGPNRLFKNNGSGFFTDVAAAAGVASDSAAMSASWGDYDNDGLLDLYVSNYATCAPDANFDDPAVLKSLTYHADRLYHNEGDGAFSDQTALVEHDPLRTDDGSTKGAGFQAAWFDYDGDTDVDLYLANDFFLGNSSAHNHLWRNDGLGASGWGLTDVSVSTGTAYAMNTMGIAIGDYDRDLDLDMALSDIESNKLLRNNGGAFTNVAEFARVRRPFQRVAEPAITWGTAFYDLNLDGWEDLYFAAGYIHRLQSPRQPNQLFVNGRNGRFLDLSAPSLANDPSPSRGVAFADYDRDGRIDMYVANLGGPPRFYRNVTFSANRHWLEVDTVGTVSNRDGCGAKLIATVNGQSLLRQVFCGSTSLSSGSDSTVHFGLGSATSVTQLEIMWPSGTRQVLQNLPVDRLISVTEGA